MPSTLTDRVAAQLLRAVADRLRASSLRFDKRGNLTAAPLQEAISQLAFQIATQGLEPADLDSPGGQDALHAVATAISPKKADAVVSFMPLPDEWKHVVNAAYRQADRILREARK